MLVRAVAIAALLTALVLGGCGGNDARTGGQSRPTPDVSAPSVPAAQGELVSTVEYSYRAPRGWVDRPKGSDPQSGSTDSFDSQIWLADTEAATLADGVTVLRIASAFSDDPGEIEQAAEEALRKEGRVRSIKTLPRQEVDGAPSTGLRGMKEPTNGGEALPLLQFVLVHDEKFFIVSFVFSTIEDADTQLKTAQSVLASWKWT